MMCNCPSCDLTDSYADKGFDAWPKGEHINRSAKKDKAYTTHWNYCGAEAHKRYDKPNLKAHLAGKNVSTYANAEAYRVPLPDNDVWIPIFQWERETGENYLDRCAELKAEQQRKAA